MRAKLVAKQQRVALIWPTRESHVYVGGALSGQWREQQLGPVLVWTLTAGRAVVVQQYIGGVAILCPAKHWQEQIQVQRVDGHLYVDDVFRRKAWYSGGADVIDPQRERTEARAEPLRYRSELIVPTERRFNDLDRNHQAESTLFLKSHDMRVTAREPCKH
jgi:hypothetical protein